MAVVLYGRMPPRDWFVGRTGNPRKKPSACLQADTCVHRYPHCRENLHSPMVTGTWGGTSEVDRLRCLREPVGKYHQYT